MHSNRKKVPKFIRWWVTPKLPMGDVYAPYAAKEKNIAKKLKIFLSQWFIHPIKRRLARAYLKALQKFTDIKVIAITGSAGKTTTKDMLASILSEVGPTAWTVKSIDSVYNIPNTILKTLPGTKYLILEMSVEFPGEMDFYLWLSKPGIGVITNVHPTHTQFLKSAKGVADEKEKLVKALTAQDTAVLNKENRYTKEMGSKTRAKILWFGKSGDFQAKNIRLNKKLYTIYTLETGKSKIYVQLAVPGTQFVQNSLAAAGAAYALGVPINKIKKGLENYKKPEHRMDIIKHASGALIIDDSYNNNPEAAICALKTLKEVANGKRLVVVMGDMLELGKLEVKCHKDIGKFIGKIGVDCLIGVGKTSKYLVEEAKKLNKNISTYLVSSEKKALPILKPYLKKNTIVLIKGSRSIGLDRLVSRLS